MEPFQAQGTGTAETILQKQPGRGPGRPWPKGTSGNRAGKPPGTRCRATLAAEQLLDGEAEALTRRAIEAALGGDTVALRICLDRILPPPGGIARSASPSRRSPMPARQPPPWVRY